MTATTLKEITNKDLLDFMGIMAEDITVLKEDVSSLKEEVKDIRETMATKEDLRGMATKEDLRSLREEIMEELGGLRAEIQRLSEREDRDTQVTLGLIADLQKRVTFLENELENLKMR